MTKIAAAADKASLPLGDACYMYGMCTRYVVTTHGDDVHKYQSRAELLQFLGPIDSPADALLLLYYDLHTVVCESTSPTSTFSGIDASSILELEDGFQVLSLTYAGGCMGERRERVTLHVATDGTVTETARETMAPETTGCVGRRPEGLRSRHVGSSASPLGDPASTPESSASPAVASATPPQAARPMWRRKSASAMTGVRTT